MIRPRLPILHEHNPVAGPGNFLEEWLPQKCAAVKANGEPCGAYALNGQEFCHFHGPGHKAAVKKAGVATADVWKRIKADAERCNLLSPANQAIFMNALIVREVEGENRWQALNAYMGHLIKLTAKEDPTGSWGLEAKDFESVGKMIGSLGYPTLVVQEGGYDTRVLGINACNFLTGLWLGAYLR